jgi:hypothetical protein
VTLPHWATDKHTKQVRNRDSARQERAQAARVGGRVQSGSGSSWRASGDVRGPEFMDEMKMTGRQSFSITEAIIRKLFRAATNTGLEPRLIIDMTALGVRAVVTFEDIP